MTDPTDVVERGKFEVAEDRRIAGLMWGQHNREVMLQRAQVTEDLVAEVERLRRLHQGQADNIVQLRSRLDQLEAS